MLLLAASSANQVKAQDGLFSKSFPDGSKVRLTRSTITEFRSRPKSANPNVPSEEIYADREWKIVTNAVHLQRAGTAESAVIWSNVWEYPANLIPSLPDTRGEFSVEDVLLRTDRAFILYYNGFYTYKVANVGSDKGSWYEISDTALAKKSVSPILEVKFEQKKEPEITVVYLVSERYGNQKRRSIGYRLKADKWQRR